MFGPSQVELGGALQVQVLRAAGRAPTHSSAAVEQLEKLAGGGGNTAVITGQLLKRGKGQSLIGRKNWKKRHFVLDKSRGTLTWFKPGKLRGEPLGELYLQGFGILELHKHEFQFQLFKDGARGLDLRALHAGDQEDWITGLTQAVLNFA